MQICIEVWIEVCTYVCACRPKCVCVWKYWWNILFPLSSFRMKVSSTKQKGLTDYEKRMSVHTKTKSMERNIKESNFAQWVINVKCHFSRNHLCSLNSEWLKYKTHKSLRTLKQENLLFSGMYIYKILTSIKYLC